MKNTSDNEINRTETQIILKDIYGKSQIINIDLDHKLNFLNLQIQDLYGLEPKSQILVANNKTLNPKKSFKQNTVKNLTTICLNNPLKGGVKATAGPELDIGFLFPQFNENTMTYGNAKDGGWEWHTISSGINIAAYCVNKKCISYKKNDYVWIYENLGIGYFNIGNLLSSSIALPVVPKSI